MPQRIGLVYEDENLRIIFESVARKVLGAQTEFEALLGGSWPGFKGDMAKFLQVLNVTHISAPLDKVFVVVDSNGENPQKRESSLRQKVQNRTYLFGEPRFYAIKRQSETLLIADPLAINKAAGKHIPPVADPENFQDPKRYLIQRLRNSGREFTREFVRNAAAHLDLEAVERHCKEFPRLRKMLEGQ